MVGKMGLSVYLPATVTSIAIPDGFLEPGTAYKWEVLAIEESGNQTPSSGEFQTRKRIPSISSSSASPRTRHDEPVRGLAYVLARPYPLLGLR